jgi:hypothetical protein
MVFWSFAFHKFLILRNEPFKYLQRNVKLLAADPGYLRFKLEKMLALFGNRMRHTDVGGKVQYAQYWCECLKKVMKEFAGTVVMEEQATWKVLVQKKPVKSISVITSLPPVVVSKNSQETVVCLKYLRHALGVVNAQTNVVPDTCSRVDCERLHNDAFHRTKAVVVAAVQAAKGEKALVDAIVADARFK